MTTRSSSDDAPDTGPQVVRTLLRLQVPELAGLSLDPLRTTGSDNALYRLGTEFVVRLPRFSDAATRLTVELGWLARLVGLPVVVPALVHAGAPSDVYRSMPVADAPPRERGQRGGPLEALDGRVRWWLERAHGLIDARAVARLWEECLEGAADDIEPALVHGDLIPGNLLVAEARLSAVIDWGALGAGDPAQDLSPAWSVLNVAGAHAFREALDVDEPSWLRGRGFALEQAIGGIVSYAPHRHPLGDVMQRTLDRLLARR